MALDNLEALLIEQLQDIYYAEKQLVKALPKMAKAASTAALATAFTNHATETDEHVARLEQAFEALGVAVKAKKCPAIEGLVEEAADMMAEDGLPSVLDAGLIASAQRVEHYEIAAYSNARAFADALGRETVVGLLEATLEEEHAADDLLSTISIGTVIPAALQDGLGNEEDEDAETVPAGSKRKVAVKADRRVSRRSN